MLLEEPEANLHPAFQSKLADLFSEVAVDYEQQLIVETHSEYMVRKFQYLVVLILSGNTANSRCNTSKGTGTLIFRSILYLKSCFDQQFREKHRLVFLHLQIS